MKHGGLERRCHWLSRNKGSKRPGTILFLDAEAQIENPSESLQEHTFRLGVAALATYSPERGLETTEWRDLQAEEDLWVWVDEISREVPKLLIVSHNIDYDARLCRAFFWLPHTGWSPTYAVMAKSCTLFEWEHGKRKLTLLDNMNLWQSSLEQLGKSVGLPKLSVDFDAVSDQELLVYCRRDVEILVRLWQQWFEFLDEHDLGSFGITAARQAWNAYRHHFRQGKIGIHNNAVAASLAREAYHGGRSECFVVGQAPGQTYYKLDVNGLYAAMMSQHEYPRKLVKVIQNVSVEYLSHLLDHYLIIAEVVVEAHEPVYVYPIRGRNAYPTGTFLTTLTTPELRIACAEHEIRGVGRVVLYEPGDLFSHYVDYFTPLRQQYKAAGDVARSRMCKLLRNSLQGKFGQRAHKQEVLGDAPIDQVRVRRWLDAESGRSCVDWTFGGKVLRQYDGGEPYDSLPAIPAHVAAYGRVEMWRLIKKAKREHVFYVDTDSLIVDVSGYLNLESEIDPLRLGALKVEGRAGSLEIYAKKDYRFGDLRTVKGIKSNATELAPDLYEQWHFTTIKYGFAARDLDGVTLHKVQKQLRYGRVAGTVGSTGRIQPPHLHLGHDALLGYLADPEHDRVWVWEFDPVWLKQAAMWKHLRERVTYQLRPFRAPSQPSPPPPLALEPLGDARSAF